MCFVFTDAEVKDEGFLEYINQILSTGEVSGLFAKDEVDAIIGDMRPVAKKEAGKGFVDSVDNLWKYFLQRARANLHVVLCMSPVGTLLSTRTRKFPGLINCTTVDWFLPWPESGLRNVAESFIDKFDMVCKARKRDSERVQALMYLCLLVSLVSIPVPFFLSTHELLLSMGLN